MSHYWDSSEQAYKPIPGAYYYVLGNDRTMSGWGQARGKTNTVVVPCGTPDNWHDAEAEAARAESKMESRGFTYIRVRRTKPQNKPGVLYSLIPEWAKRPQD